MTDLHFHPPLIAHRGESANAPENTMAAFRRVPESGAKWMEFDVRLTHDGVPVIMHDDTLDRTTNGKGAVADTLWAEMQTLDAGSWFDPKFAGARVPHLAEVLRFALDHNLRPMIELKPCEGREQATAMVTLIEAAKIWPRDHASPLILGFDRKALAIAAQFQPHWPRALSFSEWQEDWREQAAQIGAGAITIDADLLTPQRLRLLAQSGLAILAYTVNDPARAKELLRQGVSAVFCDNPAEMAGKL